MSRAILVLTKPTQSPNRRKLTTLLLAMLALLTLAVSSCASIPASGPVREGLGSLDQVERGVQFNPAGPQPDASQEEIVRGFVIAASSSTNDYEVAREFLAPVYANTWDPSRSVLVDEGTQQVQISQDNIATVSLRVVANVDDRGTLTLAEPDRTTEVQFELARVQGEWRISSAPDGIILAENLFTTVWAPRPLYYVSTDLRLVAEMRWFLNRSTQNTQIVRELLRGPSEQMQQALHTAFPNGTMLSSESVPNVDGIAVINLTPELFEADDATMDLLMRQVSLSLPATVAGFQLSVHGAVVEAGTVTSAEDTVSGEQQFIGVMKEGQFGALAAGTVRPVTGVSERIDELSPDAVSLSTDHTAAAVLSDEGVSWVRDFEVVGIDSRPGLLAPSLDALGYVWVYDRGQPGVVKVARPDGFETTIAAPWIESREVVAVRVSTGANRIATLVEDEGGSRVLVAGIVRDELGQPVAFTEEATTELWVPGAPRDLDWIGDTRFVTLSESGLLGSSARVTIGVTGSFSTDSGAVAGGSTVSGGSRSLLRVLDDQERLFAPQGLTGWQQVQDDVQLVAKVG